MPKQLLRPVLYSVAGRIRKLSRGDPSDEQYERAQNLGGKVDIATSRSRCERQEAVEEGHRHEVSECAQGRDQGLGIALAVFKRVSYGSAEQVDCTC